MNCILQFGPCLMKEGNKMQITEKSKNFWIGIVNGLMQISCIILSAYVLTAASGFIMDKIPLYERGTVGTAYYFLFLILHYGARIVLLTVEGFSVVIATAIFSDDENGRKEIMSLLFLFMASLTVLLGIYGASDILPASNKEGLALMLLLTALYWLYDSFYLFLDDDSIIRVFYAIYHLIIVYCFLFRINFSYVFAIVALYLLCVFTYCAFEDLRFESSTSINVSGKNLLLFFPVLLSALCLVSRATDKSIGWLTDPKDPFQRGCISLLMLVGGFVGSMIVGLLFPSIIRLFRKSKSTFRTYGGKMQEWGFVLALIANIIAIVSLVLYLLGNNNGYVLLLLWISGIACLMAINFDILLTSASIFISIAAYGLFFILGGKTTFAVTDVIPKNTLMNSRSMALWLIGTNCHKIPLLVSIGVLAAVLVSSLFLGAYYLFCRTKRRTIVFKKLTASEFLIESNLFWTLPALGVYWFIIALNKIDVIYETVKCATKSLYAWKIEVNSTFLVSMVAIVVTTTVLIDLFVVFGGRFVLWAAGWIKTLGSVKTITFERDKYKKEVDVLSEQLKAEQAKTSQLEKTEHSLRAKETIVETKNEQIKQLSNDLEKAKQREKKLEQEKQEMLQKYSKLSADSASKEAFHQLEELVKSKAAKLEETELLLGKRNEAYASEVEKGSSFKAEIERLKKSAERLKTQLDKSTQELRQKELAVKTLEEKNAELQKELEKSQAKTLKGEAAKAPLSEQAKTSPKKESKESAAVPDGHAEKKSSPKPVKKPEGMPYNIRITLPGSIAPISWSRAEHKETKIELDDIIRSKRDFVKTGIVLETAENGILLSGTITDDVRIEKENYGELKMKDKKFRLDEGVYQIYFDGSTVFSIKLTK